MASPVRLLHRDRVVLALLHFAISVFQEVSVNSFPVTSFLMAIQVVTGLPVLICSPVTGFVTGPCACSLIFSLRIVAGHVIIFSWSRDNDVGDADEVEPEERVDKTLDNEEHEVLRRVLNFLPLFMRCSN